jgi:two-component system chemotaxis response regulator CheY
MVLKLMTVDDSRTIRRIVSSYATALAPDVEIMEAADGKECLEKCKETLPDIIILDVNMPVMNGEDCLRSLREQEATKDVPVVMLTTESEKQLVVRLLQLGVQQFIIKPFEKKEFIEKVGGVLAKVRGSACGGDVPTPEGKYMIVLEDKENIIKTINEAAAGILEVVSTSDAGVALNHLRTRAPVLVLANLALEGTDALELFAQMRGVPNRGNVRFAGMCLKTAMDLIGRARRTGYVDVLPKPFAAADVTQLLSSKTAHSVETEADGDIYVIHCEGTRFQTLIPLIHKAVEGAAEEGFMKVLIDLAAVAERELGDLSSWGSIAEKVGSLGLAASYIAPSADVVLKLKEVVDTKDLRVVTSHDEAKQALAA